MEWLEDYLTDFHGGLVVVSHDRVFLDRVASEVRELDHAKLELYAMRFTDFLEERERRREQVEAHNQQVEKRIAQLERFVTRFGAKNTKATQAQSKRKMIARLHEERVVLPRRPRHIRFHFPAPPHSGRLLVRLRDASFAYDGGAEVFSRASLEIEQGEKIAIVGANGAGKTTLLRVLAGQLAPVAGDREVTPQTRLGYFAQHAAETLEPAHTVIDALEEIASSEWRPRLRGLLGNFLFSGDDVFKLCRILSGGERQRVAIARMLLEPANLMLLDEPTHHLDLAGKEVLEEALEQYPGSLIVVTHDRSLMARVARRVIEVRDGRVLLYPGGYDDWESARLAREVSRRAEAAVAVPAGRAEASRKPAAGKPAPASAPRDPASNRRAGNDEKKRQRELARVEKDIEAREARVREIEALLADPELYHDASRSRESVLEYERLRAEIESLWQRLGELG
jgi:ATP-binding cassette subfamily F protein 3